MSERFVLTEGRAPYYPKRAFHEIEDTERGLAISFREAIGHPEGDETMDMVRDMVRLANKAS
jgi:hypothetical protein